MKVTSLKNYVTIRDNIKQSLKNFSINGFKSQFL